MCRCDVDPGARVPLAEVMGLLRDRLAEWHGVDPAGIVIGPIDFGTPKPVDQVPHGM